MQMTKLVIWLLVCQIPALVGMGAVRANMAWYHALIQPAFAPPDWVFSAVWALLYVLLGVAGYWMTRNGMNENNRGAVVLFVLQLVLNACWTPIFFGQQGVGFGLFIVSMMILLTGWLMKKLWVLQQQAFWILLPYGLWLCFAWCLNYAILILN